jgi:hypothetical protein
MKTLELNEMEVIQGGGLSQIVACASTVIGVYSLVTTIAVISGPIGWIAYAGLMGTAFATGASGAYCLMGDY